MIIRPAIFDRDILALDIAGFIQALTERGREGHIARSCRAVEKPDHRHRRLLRPRRQRPRHRRPAEKRDEVAPTDVDCHVTLPWKVMPIQWRDDITLWACGL